MESRAEAQAIPAQELAELFKLFGDTTRIRILYALMQNEMNVQELADALSLSQSATSHQLSLLRKSRLVRCHRDGKNICYALADDHVQTILAQGMEHVCE